MSQLDSSGKASFTEMLHGMYPFQKIQVHGLQGVCMVDLGQAGPSPTCQAPMLCGRKDQGTVSVGHIHRVPILLSREPGPVGQDGGFLVWPLGNAAQRLPS